MVQEVVGPIARNLKRLREQQNLSISTVADRAGLSKSTLSKLERGNGNPSIDTLWGLARVLGVPFAALFEEDGQPDVEVLEFKDAPSWPGPGVGSRPAKASMAFTSAISRASRVERRSRSTPSVSRRGSASRPAAHTAGLVEHVVVIDGRADIGPDGASATLETGDRIRFPADRSHHYEALDGPARLIAILDYP